MPKVPYSDTQEIAQPQNPVTGDKFVAPENLLMAASHMNSMGRMFDSGGGGFRSLKGTGSRAKPGKSLKAK
jgi:hypothetical protein